MTHVFTWYTERELVNLTAEQLAHLELVDRYLSLHDCDPATVERMSDEELRASLSPRPAAPADPAPHATASADVPAHLHGQPLWVINAWHSRNAGRPRRSAPSTSFAAKVWDPSIGRMVHVGVFPSKEERDAAIAAAKFRRSMGLPIKPNGPTNGH